MRTYGKLLTWGIREPRVPGTGVWVFEDLEPHVAIALKRLFGRISVTATTPAMQDSDETRTDIRWFMMRYPLEVSDEDAQRLEDGYQRAQDRIAERERLLLPTWRPDGPSGFVEGKEPYNYQRQAAAVTLQNPNLLLGDDLGLGKTISALATITAGAPMPAAVVVQAHLAEQWQARIKEFTNLRSHIIKGRKPYDLPEADVYLFKFSNVIGWVDVFSTGLFKTVIYDEVQELRKGDDSAKGRACSVLSGAALIRMGLTATPIYNYGIEIYEVLRYIEEDLLGSRAEFHREWCSGMLVKDPDALGTYLRDKGYFLRRTEQDEEVATEIPPLYTEPFEVGWNEEAVEHIDEVTRTLAMKVLEGSFHERGQAARELDWRMRQRTGIAKASDVAAYVHMLLQDNERVLLAGWHREVYELWQRYLAPFEPRLYTGSESPAQKRKSVEAFCEGDSRVMMISLRSGAGLDGLQQFCNQVVFGELDWSPQIHRQVAGRLRRPGQKNAVTAHYLYTNGGSDPVIMDALGIKQDQARGIVDPGSGALAQAAEEGRIASLARRVVEGSVK